MLSVSAKPEPERLAAMADILNRRQMLEHRVRDFFCARGFLEVQTPVRVPAPALEDYIDAITADGQYLRTSPELHMKRLLAAGYERIFQLGPCFRKGELGSRHLPEFTMLEWYRLHAGYLELLTDTRELLLFCAEKLLGGTQVRFGENLIDLACPWEKLTVREAFAKFAGCQLEEALAANAFEALLVEKIEPRLGLERPAVLYDYPAAISALSKTHPQDPALVERWELYLGGLEIANACSELTEPAEQRRRFAECRKLRSSQNRAVYPEDLEFLAALESGLPPAAGIALGVERLMMIFCNCRDIREMVPFAPVKHG